MPRDNSCHTCNGSGWLECNKCGGGGYITCTIAYQWVTTTAAGPVSVAANASISIWPSGELYGSMRVKAGTWTLSDCPR